MQLWEILLIALGILFILWLTISFVAVIITMIGSPADLHDVPVDDNKGKDATKS